MTNTVSVEFELAIEVLPKQAFILLPKIDAASDDLTSSIAKGGDAMNNAACLSAVAACDKPNKNRAADNLDVQVFAAMKKA
ncbi:hypothetical protein [Paenibacillus sp. LHD-38]|uniref:hypothetical protein n=1 Tax=Paenibacillus sp. LHD-38 TaxID=3072143 RepID=UPI00280E8C03|nr:hypothetical protein [Paenibacillus sp. LHD-38]MDQ8736836.1 hypothetical protein [Paenibacillus sp. LHD-38]